MVLKKKLKAKEPTSDGTLSPMEALIAEANLQADGLPAPALIQDILAAFDTGNGRASSLQTFVILKKLEKIVKAAYGPILRGANSEFLQLGGDQIALEVLGAKVSKYTKPAKWEFSNEVVKMEIDLTAKKDYEKATGIAKNVSAPIDEEKDARFQVKI